MSEFKVGDIVYRVREPSTLHKVARVGATTLTLADGSSSHIGDFRHDKPPVCDHPFKVGDKVRKVGSPTVLTVSAVDSTPRQGHIFKAAEYPDDWIPADIYSSVVERDAREHAEIAKDIREAARALNRELNAARRFGLKVDLKIGFVCGGLNGLGNEQVLVNSIIREVAL